MSTKWSCPNCRDKIVLTKEELATIKAYHVAAEKLLSEMDWGRSALSAEAIGGYNEAAVAAKKAIIAIEGENAT